MKMKNKAIGSDFDDFLSEEGLLENSEATAVKRVIAYQIEQTMKKKRLSKTVMARMMHTSRSAVERLLDSSNNSVTLLSLEKAAMALGKKLRVELS